MMTLWNDILEIISSGKFSARVSTFDRRPLIAQADALGGPEMLLLHWDKLRQLERIPRFDEDQAMPAIQGIERFSAPFVEIFMVSHKWLRPSIDPEEAHPDTEDNAKAHAINEFSEWRRQWVSDRHGFLPEIYYWIDYSCIDQDNTASAAPLLPLWVACCERFLRVETPDYDERAWCRLETMLSHVFSFADHHTAIGLDYRDSWPDTGSESARMLLDPRAGKLTNPTDMALIEPLVDIALRAKPSRRDQRPVHLDATMIRCFQL
jgi:hypothetical protein